MTKACNPLRVNLFPFLFLKIAVLREVRTQGNSGEERHVWLHNKQPELCNYIMHSAQPCQPWSVWPCFLAPATLGCESNGTAGRIAATSGVEGKQNEQFPWDVIILAIWGGKHGSTKLHLGSRWEGVRKDFPEGVTPDRYPVGEGYTLSQPKRTVSARSKVNCE